MCSNIALKKFLKVYKAHTKTNKKKTTVSGRPTENRKEKEKRN